MESKGLFKFLKIDQLLEKLTAYIEVRIELFKLEAKEELGQAVSKAIFWFVVFILSCFSLLFLSVGLAVWLGAWMQNAYIGFVIMGCFYLGLLVTLFFLEKPLQIIEKTNKRIQEAMKSKKDDKRYK